MSVRLDHLTIPSRDRRAAAESLAQILGVAWGEARIGPFSAVYASDELTLDFDQADGPFPVQHYCFHVSEPAFDALLARLAARTRPRVCYLGRSPEPT